MVGVAYLSADLWTLRTTAAKLDETVRRRIDCLCLHRRPTRRGCRAGRLVPQRRFPDDRSTTECDTETETDGQSTVKPIPVIQPSRRRSIRSAAGHCTSSSRSIFTSVSQPAALSPVDDESDNYSQSSLFSASSQHETTATSWCPSTLSSDDRSPSRSATDDPAVSTVTRTTRQHPRQSNLSAVPLTGRHSACPTTSRLLLGALNVRSLNNKVDAVRDLFNSRQVDVVCLCGTWHENSDAVPIARLRTNGLQVLERARPISSSAAATSGDFTNYGGLAVVARCGLNLSRVMLPWCPTTFECDCIRLSSSGSSCLLLVLYRPGSQHVTSQFFDDLARVLEFLSNQSQQLELTGNVNIRLDRPTDSSTVRFNDLLESFALAQHVSVSTHRLGGTLE